MTRVCVPTTNARVKCARCYRPDLCPGKPEPDLSVKDGLTRPRDFVLERQFVDTAARAADCYTPDGTGEDFGLSDFADKRALPGGVRVNMDHRREACEEAADLRNYLVWRAESVYADALAGDALALDQYEWSMRCLSKLVPLWRELLRESA